MACAVWRDAVLRTSLWEPLPLQYMFPSLRWQGWLHEIESRSKSPLFSVQLCDAEEAAGIAKDAANRWLGKALLVCIS